MVASAPRRCGGEQGNGKPAAVVRRVASSMTTVAAVSVEFPSAPSRHAVLVQVVQLIAT